MGEDVFVIFVTGPLFAGKQKFVQDLLGWSEDDFRMKAVRDAERLAADADDLCDLAEKLSGYEAVIANEVGGGIVPADPEERIKREAAGRLSCLLAERADTVIRVCCGLPQVLKMTTDSSLSAAKNDTGGLSGDILKESPV